MPRRYGLTGPQRLAIMREMRVEGVDDPIIGRVFGISRQRVGQELGPHTPAETDGPLTPEKLSYLRMAMLAGATLAEIAEGIQLPYRQTIYLARTRSGITHADHLAAKRRRREHHLEEELRAYLTTGWPLTSVWLRRYDQRHGTGLFWRATSIAPIASWRIRLGVESTTRLFQRRIVSTDLQGATP